MVKPGMAYLDIVRQTKDKVHNGLFTFSNFHSQDLAIFDRKCTYHSMLISLVNFVKYVPSIIEPGF